MSCAFCKNLNIKNRTIVENDLAKAFVGMQPIVPGHTLVIPKRCVAKFNELTSEEIKAIFDIMDKVKTALQKTFKCEGFNHAWNENLISGQTVPHFHLHIVPRRQGDEGIYEYEPRKFLYRSGSRANSEQEELSEVAELIKSNL